MSEFDKLETRSKFYKRDFTYLYPDAYKSHQKEAIFPRRLDLLSHLQLQWQLNNLDSRISSIQLSCCIRCRNRIEIDCLRYHQDRSRTGMIQLSHQLISGVPTEPGAHQLLYDVPTEPGVVVALA
jgi:hypothetical protein